MLDNFDNMIAMENQYSGSAVRGGNAGGAVRGGNAVSDKSDVRGGNTRGAIGGFAVRPEAEMNETETRILRAAEREFMTKGFAGARTTSIAEAAGVTHAMFHYYFRTKDKLFERIVSEKMEMLKGIILQSLTDMGQPLEEIIRKLINTHLDFISANPDLPRFIISELYSSPGRMEFFFKKINAVAPDVISRLQQKIDALAAEGKCRRVDAVMLMLDIVSLNIFPYVAGPLVNKVLGGCMDNAARFAAQRKEENYNTIMRKLGLTERT